MISIAPVGQVVGGRAEPFDDDWGAVRARVELGAGFGPEALAGLDQFSHVEIVYQFDRVEEASTVRDARHPRGRADWPKVGIFAQRGKARPNRIGVSICRLIAVDGRAIEVEGLDAIAGSPVLDIKPVMRGFLPRGTVTEPAWEGALMAGYWGAGDAAQRNG